MARILASSPRNGRLDLKRKESWQVNKISLPLRSGTAAEKWFARGEMGGVKAARRRAWPRAAAVGGARDQRPQGGARPDLGRGRRRSSGAAPPSAQSTGPPSRLRKAGLGCPRLLARTGSRRVPALLFPHARPPRSDWAPAPRSGDARPRLTACPASRGRAGRRSRPGARRTRTALTDGPRSVRSYL